jgi:hypothetical protein
VIRLASVDGQPTIELGVDPVLAWAQALVETLERGEVVVEKCILVAMVDGDVTYTAAGSVSIMEATGLLELASRRIERDALA